MRIELAIEKQNNVSGSRQHGAIYPMFSNWANSERLESKDSENMGTVLYRKITIEDGEFKNAYSSSHKYDKYSYTGQHTNLVIELDTDGICKNTPEYVYGSLFMRNKYGCQKRKFRLDMIRCQLQIQRGKNKKWFDFIPKQYID